MSEQLQEYGLTPEQMLDCLEAFGERVRELLSQLGLDLRSCQADHIALRINSPMLAEKAHNVWKTLGKEISSAHINGRPIIVFKLTNGIHFADWSVDCLELPYPAEGKIYPAQGWEHVEFVIHSKAQTADEYLADLKQRFPELERKWASLSEMGIKAKLSSPKGEAERLANPTVAFKKDGVCIKLHPHSLEEVIQSEQAA
ncbi:VOC family protein [Vibrio albus]|uniref:VOC family protein n=1 Tax=Vibrio albus TaxID=2200953 RepID=A0A2U3BD22_9VIBR|nr:VOC family protein [Vibrio albus]PWI34681.1 VOC family protein [Vibrio albus]